MEGVVIEAKIPLQTMGPLPSSGGAIGTPPSSSNMLAMVPLFSGAEAPSLYPLLGAELDEELQRVLAPLRQGEEVDDSAAVTMDLSFMESMAVGVKEMQAGHSQKWQVLKDRHESTDKVNQELKDKCLGLREWHGKQFQVLLRQ